MNDLTIRLRAWADENRPDITNERAWVCLEAADTIEIMEREIADLKAAYEGCCKDLEDAEVTCAELDEELEDLKAQHLLTQAEAMHRIIAAANGEGS